MNLAVFCPNWVGDVVMATPAFRALRSHYRAARIVGVLRPYVAGVLEGGDWFDELIHLSGKSWSRDLTAPLQRLRRAAIDLAVLFPNSFRSALIARLAGCRRIIGYARGGRGFLLTDRLPPLRDAAGRFVPSPIIDAYAQLAAAAGCPAPGRRMELFTTPADEAAADRVWQIAGLDRADWVAAMHPGAAFGAAKHWPLEYFAELSRRLAKEQEASVLVLCGPAERELARRIVALAGHARITSLADAPVTLGLLKACVRRADLLVTTDSGPRHFAAAFDRPVITLFGPTHISWTETYFAKAVHLQKQVDCGPCQLRVCPLDHRCMKLLLPGEVMAAARELLARHPPPTRLRRAS